jgi:hypothetical protein
MRRPWPTRDFRTLKEKNLAVTDVKYDRCQILRSDPGMKINKHPAL